MPDHRALEASELCPGGDGGGSANSSHALAADAHDPPTTYDRGTSFTSVCINTAVYLPWLLGRARAAGVTFRRAVVQHVTDAAALARDDKDARASSAAESPSADDLSKVVVVNCTALGARTLGGVHDDRVTAARAQIVLVRNSAGGAMVSSSGSDDNKDELCYVMERAAGQFYSLCP